MGDSPEVVEIQSGIEDITDDEWQDDTESIRSDFLLEETAQDLSNLTSSWMLPL